MSTRTPTPAHPARASLAPPLFAATLLLALAACHKSGAALPDAPAPIVTDVTLTQATNCDALSASVIDAAVLQMREQLETEKSYDGCCLFNGAAPTAGAASPASSGSAPASYSTTNDQVAGVDEADFMKNDGTRIFTLSGQTLHTATSWPASALALEGTLTIEGWPNDMFLDGNQVVVFSSIWTVPTGGGLGPGSSYGFGGPVATGVDMPCELDGSGCFYGWGTTKITVVDVTNLAAPTVTAQLYLPGSETGARRVNSSIRLVLTDSVRWPEAIQWWPTYSDAIYQNHDLWVDAINALEDSNEAIIRATPLQSWFPDGQRTLQDGSTVDVSYSCSDFYLSNAPEQLGLVTVATLDLGNLAAGVTRASIVGDAGILYATANHLYLATQHWWWWPEPGQQDWTYIHEFDISDPLVTTYIASGGVQGHIGDQFSLDESNNYLRVATSTAVSSTDAAAVDGYVVGSVLSVLAPEKVMTSSGSLGNALQLVGEIPSLGQRAPHRHALRGRYRLCSHLPRRRSVGHARPVRSDESKEDRRADHPRVLHLSAADRRHPLVGHRRGFPGRPRRRPGLQPGDHPALALRRHRPVQSAALGGGADRHSLVVERRALGSPRLQLVSTRSDPAGDIGHPLLGLGRQRRRRLLGRVREQREALPSQPRRRHYSLGALDMSDIYIQASDDNWSWYYRPWVRRSVLSTDTSGNTFVYAISDAGLRSAALGDLTAPLATALFPDATTTAPSMRAAR